MRIYTRCSRDDAEAVDAGGFWTHPEGKQSRSSKSVPAEQRSTVTYPDLLFADDPTALPDGEVTLELDVPEAELRQYEQPHPGDARRTFHLPASVANTHRQTLQRV